MSKASEYGTKEAQAYHADLLAEIEAVEAEINSVGVAGRSAGDVVRDSLDGDLAADLGVSVADDDAAIEKAIADYAAAFEAERRRLAAEYRALRKPQAGK